VPAPEGRRRPGPRRALTEDGILDAALSLLDGGGVHAASVRGIAAKLGVAPNAVYTYFPDKSAVVRALVDRLLGEAARPTAAGRPWRERVESWALHLRASLSAHPGAVGLVLGGPLDGPHALALDEHLRELLAGAALPRAEAARAARLLIGYVLGSVALEVADLHRTDPPLAGPGPVADDAPGEQYLWGLRRVLDGLDSSAGAVLSPAG
jgi:TetR/AcrR family tetracycline transcriptional repressor